jgi:hypothetical protein
VHQPGNSSASASQVTIREFQPGDETAFRKLNEEWITRYFQMEAKDLEALSDPQSTILASGGRTSLRTSETSVSAAVACFVPAQTSSRLERWRSLHLARGAASGANCFRPR